MSQSALLKLTAKEARETTQQVINNRILTEVSEVNRSIEIAVKAGYFTTTVGRNLSEEVQQLLIDNNYKINKLTGVSREGGTEWKIDWK